MKRTNVNLIPDIVNPTPDYYCTWQTQLYATSDGKPKKQRAVLSEKALFDKEKPYGWAYFYENARKDLFLVMDDSWDVPVSGECEYRVNPDEYEAVEHYGSLILNEEKFPEAVKSSKTNAEALKKLTERIKALGWKGLGGWVCAQESSTLKGEDTTEEYIAKKAKGANDSGFAYWKVDWGRKSGDAEFRKTMTEIAKEYAPNLTVEHAVIPEVIPYSDVYRTYDVPEVMSIPLTMEKLAVILLRNTELKGGKGLINCEDEMYTAAAGGFSMGVMRHPYAGSFPDGRADLSFPEVHRNVKTKMFEVVRAARWHRIAPAFGLGGDVYISENKLTDFWDFEDRAAECELWWFEGDFFKENFDNERITISSPAQIARGCRPVAAKCDKNGKIPYIVASKNPNGVFSVAALGRTLGREYGIPECEVTVDAENAEFIGVFGEYKELTIKTELKNITGVYMQDIAGEEAYDVTGDVVFEDGKIIVPGELIHKIGTSAQPEGDTSEPGAVIKLKTEN